MYVGVAPAVRRRRRGRPRLGGRVAGAVRPRRPRPAGAAGQTAGRPHRARPRPDRPGPVGGDIRRSTCLVTGGGEEPELFVKVVLREWRDGDLLWRAWRCGAPAPAGPGRLTHHEVEHEASMALLAARAGVRTPEVLLVQSFDSGAGMLVQQRIAGQDLGQLDAARIDDALLTEVWRQVGLLHKAGIAHGELVPANCMVDTAAGPGWSTSTRPGRPRAACRSSATGPSCSTPSAPWSARSGPGEAPRRPWCERRAPRGPGCWRRCCWPWPSSLPVPPDRRGRRPGRDRR